jgi:hypothetical protein
MGLFHICYLVSPPTLCLTAFLTFSHLSMKLMACRCQLSKNRRTPLFQLGCTDFAELVVRTKTFNALLGGNCVITVIGNFPPIFALGVCSAHSGPPSKHFVFPIEDSSSRLRSSCTFFAASASSPLPCHCSKGNGRAKTDDDRLNSGEALPQLGSCNAGLDPTSTLQRSQRSRIIPTSHPPYHLPCSHRATSACIHHSHHPP